MKAVPIEQFGRDHWSTLLYIESRCVDNGGALEIKHMRCNPKNHLEYAHEGGWSDQYSTRIRSTPMMAEPVVLGHDDWDCASDLYMHGLIYMYHKKGGRGNPYFGLTDLGWMTAMRLRRNRAEGKSDAEFNFEVRS